MAERDPRLTPARLDLAAEHLRGKVEAKRFAPPTRRAVIAPVTPLLRRKDITLAPDTELLRGELIDIYERTEDWVWGQAVRDGYVGYVTASDIALTPRPDPTHAVQVLSSRCFAVPEMKTPSAHALPFGAEVNVLETKGDFALIARAPDLWLAKDHLRQVNQPLTDWVATAEMFLHLPYVWGGRSSFGLDCSALVQMALQAAGIACPRDSDMQEAALGETLPPGTPPRRGDLIFWKGHVGLMLDTETLLHATAYTMQVRREKLSGAVARIKSVEFGEITRHARLDG